MLLDPTDSVGRAGHFTDKEMKLRNLSQWTKDTGLRIGPGALHPGTRSFCDPALCSQGLPLTSDEQGQGDPDRDK